MKFQNLSVKRLFGRVALGLVLSMSGITIALFLVTKQTAALLTGGAMLLCALAGIFVLTQAFGKRFQGKKTFSYQTIIINFFFLVYTYIFIYMYIIYNTSDRKSVV